VKIFLLVLVAALSLNAQTAPVWTMQSSGTHASLRGIHSVDGKVAWASGSGGTVLRTIDGGEHWTQCATPDAAKDGAKLDFRGVQAWDANTAIVMSSGPDELSRLYKTTDGCKTWKLLFQNSDKNGFWDSFIYLSENYGTILGDPTDGQFTLFYTNNSGETWHRIHNRGLNADAQQNGAFASSNSNLLKPFGTDGFITGGKAGSFLYKTNSGVVCLTCNSKDKISFDKQKYEKYSISLKSGTESSGAFSIDISNYPDRNFVAVGGDYTKPNESSGTAAWSNDGGKTWTASTKPPHGYRSTVQWSDSLKLWLTAGTNGSDFSTDDGKTWKPLDDGNWNALSLPFLVGSDGRIARLNEAEFVEKLKTVKSQ
jgi:photosystem II stability/assembly factor-like uncharacterized protein